MKVLKVSNEEFQIIYEVAVDKELWISTVSNQKQGMIKNIKIDGFRKGKVPLNIAEKYLDINQLFNKSINKIIEPTLEELQKSKEYKENYQIVTADLDIDVVKVDFNELVIKFIYDRYPTFNNLKYKDIDVSNVKKHTISESDVEQELNKNIAKYKTVVNKDSLKLQKGDIAVFDFVGYKDGEKFSGGTGQNYELEIGSNQFIPGFEEQMIGMNIGEEKDINLSFPKDYHVKDLAGSPVTFKVKLNSIKVAKTPVLDEDFFKKTEFKDIASNKKEFENYIKSQLQKKVDQDYDIELKQVIINYLLSNNPVSHLPQKMVDNEFNAYYKQYEDQVSRQNGIKLDEIFKILGEEEKQKTINQIKEKSKSDLVLSLIFESIAEKEKILVTDKEREEFVIKQFNLSEKDLEEISRKDGDKPSKLDAYIQMQKDTIDTYIISNKVWDFIFNKCLKK